MHQDYGKKKKKTTRKEQEAVQRQGNFGSVQHYPEAIIGVTRLSKSAMAVKFNGAILKVDEKKASQNQHRSSSSSRVAPSHVKGFLLHL